MSNNDFQIFYHAVSNAPDLRLVDMRFEQPAGVSVLTDTAGNPKIDPRAPFDIVFRVNASNLTNQTGSVPIVLATSQNILKSINVNLSELLVGDVVKRMTIDANVLASGLVPLTATLDPAGTFVDQDRSNNVLQKIVNTVSPLTISIDKVRMAQVVYDPVETGFAGQITLVQNKTFVPEITLKSVGFDNTSAGSFRAQFELGSETYLSDPIPASSLTTQTTTILPAKLHVKTSQLGFQSYRLTIIPGTDLTLSGPQVSYSGQLNIVHTNNVSIAVFPIMHGCSGINCYSDPTESRIAFQLQKGSYINSIFPIADGGVSLSRRSSIIGSNNRMRIYDTGRLITRGMLEDIAALESNKKAVTHDTRAVGIVGSNYFIKQNPDLKDLVGMARSGSTLVDQSSDSTIAHELIHTFIDENESSCHEDYICAPRLAVSGYDALAASFKQNLASIMGTDVALGNAWIDQERYGVLLHKLQLPQVDPALLVVSGLLSDDGKFEVLRAVKSTEGFTDTDTGNDLKIDSVDASGRMRYSLNLKENFKITATWRDSITAQRYGSEISATTVPVVFAIPYDPLASEILISLSGRTPTVIIPASNILKTAVSSIPRTAFKAVPEISAQLLNAKVDLITVAMSQSRNSAALALLLVLKAEINLVTKDFSAGPGGYSKTETLDIVQDTIDMIISRLKAGRK